MTSVVCKLCKKKMLYAEITTVVCKSVKKCCMLTWRVLCANYVKKMLYAEMKKMMQADMTSVVKQSTGTSPISYLLRTSCSTHSVFTTYLCNFQPTLFSQLICAISRRGCISVLKLYCHIKKNINSFLSFFPFIGTYVSSRNRSTTVKIEFTFLIFQWKLILHFSSFNENWFYISHLSMKVDFTFLIFQWKLILHFSHTSSNLASSPIGPRLLPILDNPCFVPSDVPLAGSQLARSYQRK